MTANSDLVAREKQVLLITTTDKQIIFDRPTYNKGNAVVDQKLYGTPTVKHFGLSLVWLCILILSVSVPARAIGLKGTLRLFK